MMNNKTKGYLLATIAAATYGTNPLFTLPLYDDGMNAESVLFFRYLFAIVLLIPMITMRGRSFKVEKRFVLPLIFMGALLALSSITLFESYNHMEAGIASTILFVYPIIVAMIMAIFFRERLSVIVIVCLLLAFLGVVMLYDGEEGAELKTVGLLFVLASSLSYAIYIVGVNKSSLKDMPTLTLTFYVLFVGLFMFFIKADCGANLQVPTRWYSWFSLLALGFFPTVISFSCTTQAVQYVGSTPTAILGALEPVTALIFGITIFGERLNATEWCGVFVVILAVTVVVAEDRISKQLLRFRKMFPSIRKS